jgi:hypothetical protein
MVLMATYPDGKLFYNLVASMEGIIGECLFTISAGGIRISVKSLKQRILTET